MASIDSRPRKKGRCAATPEDFEKFGGEIMARSTDGGKSAAVFEARFITFFGAICLVVADVWNRLVDKGDPELESAEPFICCGDYFFSSSIHQRHCFASLLAFDTRGLYGTGASSLFATLHTLLQMW